MSRGEIVRHAGDCRYKVRLKYDIKAALAEKERITSRLAELAVEVPNQKTVVLQQDALIRAKQHDINLAIMDLQNGSPGAQDAIKSLQVELQKLGREYTALKIKQDQLVAENLSLLKRRGQIERIPEDKLIDAWCADFSDDLTGDVGLADLNDEGGRGVIIRPGYSDGAKYDQQADGNLVPREAQSGPQVFYNAAILPGIQKWRPRYRVGTITSMKGDACTVDLDPAKSSAQELEINETTTLTGVPVVYMDCNSDAFQDGDRVLVRFTQSGALVVGFESNPRECTPTVLWNLMYAPGGGWFGRAKSYDPRGGEGWTESEVDFKRSGATFGMRVALAVSNGVPHALESLYTGSVALETRVVTPTEVKLTLYDAAGAAEIDGLWMTPQANYVLIAHLDSSNMIVRKYDPEWNLAGEFTVPDSPQNGATSYGENFIAVTKTAIAVGYNRNAFDGIYRIAIFDLDGTPKTTISLPGTDTLDWLSATKDTFVVSRSTYTGPSTPDPCTLSEYSEDGILLKEVVQPTGHDNDQVYWVATRDYLYEWHEKWYTAEGDRYREILVYDRSVTRDQYGYITSITYEKRADELVPPYQTEAGFGFFGMAFDILPPPSN